MKKKSAILSQLPISLLFFTALLEGFLTMGIELLGANLLGPYYGSSLYVWTTIIGITLISLSFGYYFGGIYSTKFTSTKGLTFLLFFTGFFIFIIPSVTRFVLTKVLDLPILTGTILGAFSFLFLPLCLLGMISPNIINLLTKSGITSGKSAGTTYAISTMAGIFSVLLYGFWLIPEYGLAMNIYMLAILVLLFNTLLSIMLKMKWFSIISIVSVLIIVSVVIGPPGKRNRQQTLNVKTIHQSEGLLGQVKVMDNDDNQSRNLYVNNSLQTSAHLTGRSLLSYVYNISTFLSHRPAGSKVLLAGIGGGNLIYELALFNFDVEAVEIDKRIEEVAKKYFMLPQKIFKIYIDDARHFIKTTNQKYDIIILDMSSGETMPANVYTQEAFMEMKRLLNPNGIVVLHFVSIASDEGMVPVRSIGKTFKSAGYQTYLLNTSPNSTEPSPFIFVATADNINFNGLEFIIDPSLPAALVPDKNHLFMNISFQDGYLLSDDKPILDVLHKAVIMSLRRDNIESMVKPFAIYGLDIFN